MKKLYIYIVLFLAASFSAYSQNLDPTVEVRRTYEGKLLEAHKPQIGMSVPDSLLRFELDFDYSVFDNPYKGSYEFSPYKLAMAPVRSSIRPGRFHLRAGAGYELNPVLDLVWSPVQKNRFRMDIYATHRSFIGKYRMIEPNLGSSSSGATYIPEPIEFRYKGNKAKGYDIVSEAGMDLRYDWYKGRFDFGASYYGIAQKDWNRKRGYDALDLNIGVSSKSDREEYFLYNIKAAYRFAEDKSDYVFNDYLGEHNFEFDAVLGPVFGRGGSLLFDIGLDLASYSGALETTAGNFHIVPHYKVGAGRWIFDLGVRISALVPGTGDSFRRKGQFVYPDVTISVSAIPQAMKIYFHAGGGERMNMLSSILRNDSHYDMFALGSGSFMDNTIERFSTVLGFEGRISTRFGYHLRGGYVNYKQAMLDGVAVSVNKGAVNCMPEVIYGKYNKWFIGLDWDWKAESIDFNGSLLYNGLTGVDSQQSGFRPAPFIGSASFTYNWKRRIYIGADCAWSTSREGLVSISGNTAVTPSVKPSERQQIKANLPGYADLGVNFEYAFNRKFSLWVRGGNLLNATILRSPLYAEGGISFTAGICLNL